MRSRPGKLIFRVFDFLASLELAVFLILTLAVVLAIGTIYESRYGAAVASREVYRSLGMQLLLWLFMLNLAAAALSRLPWKSHHIGFLVTHLGIIVLLLGSWATQRAGVDGSVLLAPGESSRSARIDESMIHVFRVEPGKAYEHLFGTAVDFDTRRPLKKPLRFSFSEAGRQRELWVRSYLPRASRQVSAEDQAPGKGLPAIRFRLSGSRAAFSEWLFLQPDVGASRAVGPAVFRFSAKKPDLRTAPDKATVWIWTDVNPVRPPRAAVARSKESFRELGPLEPGKPYSLGWMDFQLQLEEYHPSALPRTRYEPIERLTPGADPVEVVELGFGQESIWLEMGSSGQVPEGDALYYLQYGKRQVDFGFELKLREFRIGYYEGTRRPRSYESEVEFEGRSQVIQMNEPLHHNGFTFYQSSYETEEDGTPRFSVLSVNRDPGRATKYAGSLMIVLGITSMFYFRPVYSGRNRWLMKKEKAA